MLIDADDVDADDARDHARAGDAISEKRESSLKKLKWGSCETMW